MRKIIATSAIALLALTGCSSSDSTEETTTTEANATSTTAAVTTSTTPTPDTAQSEALVIAVTDVYPGVDYEDVIDNARNICQEILSGKDGATLVRNAGMRFAGGDRPDPTEEQARAIVEVVRTSDWCVAG